MDMIRKYAYKNEHMRRYWMMAALVVFILFCANPISAEVKSTPELLQRTTAGNFEVPVFKSGIILLDQTPKRISVGNPNIADILILHNKQLYVIGKSLGTTNVVLWDRKDRVFETIQVEITHDIESLKVKLHDLLPGENIKVLSAQQRIILSGSVSNLVKMNAAKELAYSFLPGCIEPPEGFSGPGIETASNKKADSGSQECKEGSVVNMMQVGGAQQVMLEIKVAEINRTVLKRLDADVNILNFDGNTAIGGVSGGATFPDAVDAGGLRVPIFGDLDGTDSIIGPAVDELAPNIPTIDKTGLFLSHLKGDFFVQAVLDISRRKGLAQILAEPTLTTLTGQQAQFLSGGEFPIPVPQDANTTTIEFKEFGVGVNFLPVVLDSGQINLKLNVSVSELSNDSSVLLGIEGSASTFVVPSLSKRSAKSTVELADGQTIGIAGLISDSTREFTDKLPGLGDVPLLGTLFRSQEFRSGQTELVIFVTPHLAKPISPQQVQLPTDAFVPPSDLEFYLLGKMEAGSSTKHVPMQNNFSSGALEGSEFGHDF
ncbi:MAG: type II and III secretion system protein family protein [Gammaproteobacteria bacterium]